MLLEQLGARMGQAVAREIDWDFWLLRMAFAGKEINPCGECGKVYVHTGRWLKKHYMRTAHWGFNV